MSDPLDSDLHNKWFTIHDDIYALPILTIPQTYFSSSLASAQINNVYVITDASTKGYGAVVYLHKSNQTCLYSHVQKPHSTC